MRLIVVRHAVTAETGEILTGRKAGVSLSPKGREQASERAAELAPVDVDAVYSSPVRRCRETARILASAWGRAVAVSPGFTEADFGQWSGRSLKSLRRLRAWQRLLSAPARFTFPGGESLLDVRRRVVGATEELAAAHPEQRVLVVSHSDTIRTLLSHFLGAPIDLIHRLEVRPLSASVIDLPDDGSVPRVPVVNSLGVLEGY